MKPGRDHAAGRCLQPDVPVLTQGAVQAVAVAAVPVRCPADSPDEPRYAPRRYESAHPARTARLQHLSRARRNGDHLPDGPAHQARDTALAVSDPVAGNRWIHGHDAEEALSAPA